jgi:hypothetical protein
MLPAARRLLSSWYAFTYSVSSAGERNSALKPDSTALSIVSR